MREKQKEKRGNNGNKIGARQLNEGTKYLSKKEGSKER